MADIHQLQVKITADASGVRTGMREAVGAVTGGAKEMERSVAGLRSAFAALAPALSAAAFVSFARQAVDAAGRLNDLAGRIGFAASTLSALEAPLAASGTSLEDFAASASILNNQLGEAIKGNQEAVKAFDQLGLSVRKLSGMNEEQRFFAVADALAAIGDQAERTEAGRNLLGRGFASLNGVLTEAGGNMRGFVDRLLDLNEGLGQETIDRVDAFGDALGNAAINIRNEFLEALAAVLKVVEAVREGAKEGGFVAAKVGPPGSVGNPGRTPSPEEAYLAKAGNMGFATRVTVLPPKSAGSARGSNAGLIKPAGGGPAAKDVVKDYDELNDALGEYLSKLETERELAGLSGKALAEKRAILEANALAVKDNNLLSDEQRAKIVAEVDATYDLTEAAKKLGDQQAAARQEADRLRDQMTDGLTDIVLHFDDASDAARRFFDEIASQILRKTVTGPLAGGISDLVGDLFGGGSSGGGVFSGLGDMLGFAGGGSPPVGVPSVVGERGPEIFVPRTAGTVVPNHALGGVTVSNTWHIGGGVTKQELASLIPYIEQRTKAAVFQSIERGGTESRLVNRKG